MDNAWENIVMNAGEPERGAHALRRFEASYHELTGQRYRWSSPSGQFLARIFGNSQALSERLIANPKWAEELAKDPFIAMRKPPSVLEREITEQIKKLDPYDLTLTGRLLRLFKYRELIRIAARDLEGGSPTHELLEEWSDLADVLISTAYKVAHCKLVREHGDTCSGSIIALGKLGSRELNVSSDVDLLFIYEQDLNTTSRLSPHEFYVRLAKDVSEILSRVTEHGFVFRVDHDLRPEGAQGTLANSIDAAERYYEYFGHDWERQALIRARPVAGDMELGQQFIQRIRPFVFRKTLYLKDIQKMRRLKEKMKQGSVKGDRINIKLGDGGIRAVEFLVQAMQLIYGGRTASLQEANTFGVIDNLTEEKLIHPISAQRLKRSYSFLRRVENMIQIAQDQQIHTLPSSTSELCALARRMGYRGANAAENVNAFKGDLCRHMSQVHRLFSGMFDADYERIELIEAIDENLTSCTNEEEMRDSIPWFKHQEVRRIQHLDLEGKLDLEDTLSRLTMVAEVVIDTAWKMAWYALTDRYGTPRTVDGSTASFAILGMGKLGSQEMDYGSDLDLLFIYSGEGRTDGANAIDNSEFFTRLAQRIISLVTIRSRYGRAYEVDSELRPSGKSGMLVSTITAFLDHHKYSAEPWERMALLRARVIGGHQGFASELQRALDKFSFDQSAPDDELIRTQIRKLRDRIDNELVKETDSRYDLKNGSGGLHDLDTVVQYFQLKGVSSIPALRTRNTFKAIEALQSEGQLDPESSQMLMNAHNFYRHLLARVRLYGGHSTNEFDVNSPHAQAIAKLMGFDEVNSLKQELIRHRKEVKDLFNQIFK